MNLDCRGQEEEVGKFCDSHNCLGSGLRVCMLVPRLQVQEKNERCELGLQILLSSSSSSSSSVSLNVSL